MDSSDRKQAETSGGSRVKKECLVFTVSLQEGFRYVKAFFIGQVVYPFHGVIVLFFIQSSN